MPQYSWVEVHGATTHFPIALLLVACLLDLGAIWARKPAWREAALLLLVLAVASLPISLLSGYLTGREYARAPVGYQNHWMAAVATSIFATALLAWRLKARDQLARTARFGAIALMMSCAVTVSYTGFVGGQMVFGSRESPATVVVADAVQTAPVDKTPQSTLDNSTANLSKAAGRLGNAAVKLDVATQKITTTPAQPATPPATSPALNAKIAEMDRTAEKLNRAAERFERSAQRLERLAQAPAGPEKNAALSANSAQSPLKAAAATTAPVASPKVTAKAAAPPEAQAPSFDPQLVAEGEKLLRSEDTDCLSCHKFNGEGRAKGPDLTFAGRLHGDIEWQIAHLKDPGSKVPGSKMPAYDDLNEQQLRALGTFLASRR
jgi:uncharacterized membrane protein/cytochrome c2